MFDPTIMTTNQSKRNKTFELSFPQANKVPSRTASERGLRTSTIQLPPTDLRRNSDVDHSAIKISKVKYLSLKTFEKITNRDKSQVISSKGPCYKSRRQSYPHWILPIEFSNLNRVSEDGSTRSLKNNVRIWSIGYWRPQQTKLPRISPRR